MIALCSSTKWPIIAPAVDSSMSSGVRSVASSGDEATTDKSKAFGMSVIGVQSWH
jgi:hypothetical protein